MLRCRPLTTADLIAAAEADGPDLRAGLLARCVTGSDGQPAADLPAPAIAKVMSALSAADPLADVRLAVTCGECGHQWDTTFDIASFLWTEICAAVERLLGDVHVLARAYGWSEAEVLAVGPAPPSVLPAGGRRMTDFFAQLAGPPPGRGRSAPAACAVPVRAGQHVAGRRGPDRGPAAESGWRGAHPDWPFRRPGRAGRARSSRGPARGRGRGPAGGRAGAGPAMS